ncbi:MAG: hypothetical protein NC334_09000, partial [Bacteroides sp.]|nr:hypothetical protein [Bacteroides sp.]
MRNVDVAHRFFYDRGGSFYRTMSVSYRNDIYFSYNTAIGQIVKTISGETACIISDNTFSMTTSKHINELRAACPYYKIFRLPQEIGNQNFSPYVIVNICIRNLEYYANSKLSQKPNRENLTNYYKMLQNTLEIKAFESEFKRTKKALYTFKPIYESINDPEKLKQIKKLQAEKEKQQKAEFKKELEKVLNNYPYLLLIKAVFSDSYKYNFKDFLNTEIKIK